MCIAEVSTKKDRKKGEAVESKYSKTVLLPVTSFDQRANSLKREPELQKFWDDNKIYENLSKSNSGEKYILHDGPPYANGQLHIGHALNKILKDFINKYHTLRGKKVRFVPGWDCHGLPIELKVLQGLKTKEREDLNPLQLRKKAAEFAKEAMENQRLSFKRYGVWGDWETPYMTLQPEYEAAQIKVFGDMFLKGHIYRGKKPVYWSPSSRTALAEAELEYPENHISRSIYVGFKVMHVSDCLKDMLNEDLRVAIWTTTPWTIPANMAVAVNGEIDYCIASHPTIMNNAKFIVAKDLVKSFGSKLNLPDDVEMLIHKIMKGSELVGTKYQHPLYNDRINQILLGGDYITTESGTGLVHTAPGHGQEDYQTGLKYGLDILSPVNDLGLFTEDAGEKFMGLDVLGDGNTAIINALNDTGVLLKEELYNHKYPYDWRTKKPTIFRATEQWFASVSNFREDAINAINGVKWIPAVGKNRILSMTESRGDWCISRQRSWGVPIPVFYSKNNNQPLMTATTLKHIENIFKIYGSDAWWEMDTKDLLPDEFKHQADMYIKGTDTMDVWFDSGTSWAGVSKSRTELNFPADLYLEGSDQHRGWFQSSLLTSVASQGVAPYKTVLTHGFVLDEKGYKMSKSLGNVVDPKIIIEGGSNQKENPAFGADTLRLWVSGVDYGEDVCLGSNIMKQVSESYRKIRNTLRYLLGSLNDFNPDIHSVKYQDLTSIDKYILGKLTETLHEVEDAYSNYTFYKANQAILNFLAIDLSAFYLDIAKDRLYISSVNDTTRRRTCQTVLYHCLLQITSMMAPLVPHMAEDVWQNIPFIKSTKSIFEHGWIVDNDRFSPFESEKWALIRKIRNDVNKCIEVARQQKELGASAEVRVLLHTENSTTASLLNSMKGDDSLLPISKATNGVDDLRFIFMTSQVEVVDEEVYLINKCPTYHVLKKDSESGISVGVTKANGKKCDRCWYYSDNVGEDHTHHDVCLRCASVIRTDGHKVSTNIPVTK